MRIPESLFQNLSSLLRRDAESEDSKEKKKKKNSLFVGAFGSVDRLHAQIQVLRSEFFVTLHKEDWSQVDIVREKIIETYHGWVNRSYSEMSKARTAEERKKKAEVLFSLCREVFHESLIYRLPELTTLAIKYMNIAQNYAERGGKESSIESEKMKEILSSRAAMVEEWIQGRIGFDAKDAVVIFQEVSSLYSSRNENAQGYVVLGEVNPDGVLLYELIGFILTHINLYQEMQKRGETEYSKFSILENRKAPPIKT